jgi:hypothetical protein
MDADGSIDLDDQFTTLSDWGHRCQWLSSSGSIFGGGVKLENGYTPPRIRCEAQISMRDELTRRVLGEPGSNFLYNPIVFGRLADWVEEKTGTSSHGIAGFSWRKWKNQLTLKFLELFVAE